MEVLMQLHKAAVKDDTAGAAAALAAGAPVNGMLDGDGIIGGTALHKACLNGSADCVKLLLEAGADFNLKEAVGHRTALQLAARCNGNRSAECIAALLAAGADPCMAGDGHTALHFAAFSGRLEPVQLLFKAAPQAAVMMKSDGTTPVTMALTALRIGDSLPPHAEQMATARYLLTEAPLEAQDTGLVLAALVRAAKWSAPLFPILAGRLALTSMQWAAVPSPCPGLGTALPVVLRRSQHEAALLVCHLPEADRQQLRNLALCLGAAPRRGLLPPLPIDITRLLLVGVVRQLGEDQLQEFERSLQQEQQLQAA